MVELRRRGSREEELEFIRLVEQAIGGADDATVRTLLLTYSDEPDHGVQECVNSVLFNAVPPEELIEPVLDLLPHLARGAKRWVSLIISQLVECVPDRFIEALRDSDGATRQTVLEVVGRPYFLHLYDNAEAVYRALREMVGPSPPRGDEWDDQSRLAAHGS